MTQPSRLLVLHQVGETAGVLGVGMDGDMRAARGAAKCSTPAIKSKGIGRGGGRQ